MILKGKGKDTDNLESFQLNEKLDGGVITPEREYRKIDVWEYVSKQIMNSVRALASLGHPQDPQEQKYRR